MLVNPSPQCGRAGSLADAVFVAIAQSGLGSSYTALFGRVGGGIETKLADAGGDLSGKFKFVLNGYDKCVPAYIADYIILCSLVQSLKP